MDPYLHRLIQEGEHQRLDFKVEISDAGKIARTLVAFSNTDGGRLLIGVKDGGGIAGVQEEEEKFMLARAARDFCKPRIQYETRKWEIGKKSVLEVVIGPGAHKPYFAREEDGSWKAYIRVKDQNLLAGRILLKIWERKKQPGGSILRFSRGEKFLLNFLEDNEQITLRQFCQEARVPKFIAEKIIVSLVSMDLLLMEITEKETFYKLNREGFNR